MKRMLIIDDDKDILEALQLLLSMEGYKVKISTKTDILEKIDENYRPDVIILDVMLSGKDGRYICKELKHREATKHIPVVMISASPDIKPSVLKAGADDFLEKPFDSNVLFKKVQNIVS